MINLKFNYFNVDRHVDLSHEGQYVCRIGNEGGYSQEKLFLRVQGQFHGVYICLISV